MSTLAENLEYLRQNAFEFSLSVNPHAGCHDTIADYFNFGLADHADDWVSPEQRAEAYRTGHFVQGRVYPCGSVSFFVHRGSDIEAIVAKLVEVCRTDRARYTAGGFEIKASNAFSACEMPS